MLILTKTFAFTYVFLWMNKKSFCVSKNYVKTKSKYLEMKDLIVHFHFKVSFVCDSTGYWDVHFWIFSWNQFTKVRNENDFFRETIFNFALAFFCENSVKTTFFSSIWRFFKFLLERYLCRFSNPVLELFQQRLMKGKTFTQDLCGWKHPFTQRKLS